jgi:hypothetical protein
MTATSPTSRTGEVYRMLGSLGLESAHERYRLVPAIPELTSSERLRPIPSNISAYSKCLSFADLRYVQSRHGASFGPAA